MSYFFIIGSGLILFFWVAVSKAAVASIKEMADPDPMFSLPDNAGNADEDPDLQLHTKQTNTWTGFNGLEEVLSVDFTSQVSKKTIRCIVWKHPDTDLVLSMYFVEKRVHFEFVTLYADDCSLTTSSSIDSGFLPLPPGAYSQSFPGLTLNELWELHKEGELFLETKLKLKKAKLDTDILTKIKQSIQNQTAYVTSLFLWQIRGPYWYFVKRKLIANKKIAERL